MANSHACVRPSIGSCWASSRSPCQIGTTVQRESDVSLAIEMWPSTSRKCGEVQRKCAMVRVDRTKK